MGDTVAIPNDESGIHISRADIPPPDRRLKSEYIGLADEQGVSMRIENGEIVADVRSVKMRVKIKRMFGPGMNAGFLMRGDVFMATEAEALSMANSGQAERVAAATAEAAEAVKAVKAASVAPESESEPEPESEPESEPEPSPVPAPATKKAVHKSKK
jgi:hypothetical protein